MADTNSTGNQQGNNTGQQKPTLSWSQPAAANSNIAAKPVVTTSTSAASSNISSGTGTYVGIFVAGLIIGALIGWGITSNKSGGTSATSTATSTASSTATTATSTGATSTQQTGTGAKLTGSTVSNTSNSDNVSIASPQAAGFAVAVSKVTVTQPTWLVVYENHNGTAGNAIGAGLFFAGETSGTIQLLRATLPGQSYFVGQSLDDGDKIFSLDTDKPVRDSHGNPLFTEFNAQ